MIVLLLAVAIGMVINQGVMEGLWVIVLLISVEMGMVLTRE
jgi:hypothetical protein